MITLDQARTLSGKTMMGAGGEKLGTIDTLYADREDGDPTFATVQTGAFGTKTHFVPLAQATLSGDTVTVPYGKDLGELGAEHRPRRRARAGRGGAPLQPLRRRLRSGSGQGYDSTTTGGTTATGTTTDARRRGAAGHRVRTAGFAGTGTSGHTATPTATATAAPSATTPAARRPTTP